MSILLGNMSIKEIETRTGVKFPDALIAYMEPRRQMSAENISAGKWHCFDIPFTLVCGDRETATEIYKHLSPISGQFKRQLQIALS